MSREPDINLLVELEPEVARWRRRTMFLVSIFCHVLLALLIAFSPDLLRRSRLMMGLPAEAVRKPQLSYLWIPPEVLRRLREPPPERAAPSDRNRRAQGRAPKIDPNGLHMPYSRGNTKLPELARGAPPAPPAAAPSPPPGGSPSPPGPAAPKPAPEAPKQGEGLRLEEVRPEGGGASPKLRLPGVTPGEAIQQSLQAAARGRLSGGPGGAGDSNLQFENLNPNFSLQGPTILSDTRGVDFGPYLARIVAIVRRNWYAVIPESARLGEKGRVVIDFMILKDGSVPKMVLQASSLSDSLDRAAEAGIRLSIPFPPLPEEFTGDHLTLRFMFLYNLGYEP
jgi:TonB family protein